MTIDYLGEFIDNEQEAEEMADQCIDAIRAISEHSLDSQLSLKLTSMGLDISEQVVMKNMRRILEEAKAAQGIRNTRYGRFSALSANIRSVQKTKS